MFDDLRARFSKRQPAATAQKPVRPPPPIAGGYREPFHAVIVGSGAAALEAARTLRAQAGDLADIQLVAEERAVTPGGGSLADFAAGLGAELTVDRIVRIDAVERRIFTERRRLIDYDALVLYLDAGSQPSNGHGVDGLPSGSDERIFAVAAQQPEVVARSVAKLAGAVVTPATTA